MSIDDAEVHLKLARNFLADARAGLASPPPDELAGWASDMREAESGVAEAEGFLAEAMESQPDAVPVVVIR